MTSFNLMSAFFIVCKGKNGVAALDWRWYESTTALSSFIIALSNRSHSNGVRSTQGTAVNYLSTTCVTWAYISHFSVCLGVLFFLLEKGDKAMKTPLHPLTISLHNEAGTNLLKYLQYGLPNSYSW